MPAAEAAPLWEQLNELEFYYAGKSSVMQGATELLQKLHDDGRQLAILTRNTMPVVKQTLEACRLQHFFPVEHILDRDACIPRCLYPQAFTRRRQAPAPILGCRCRRYRHGG
jgi:phosphoglycolate phosphatase-like HAD superfamily hydrolase